MGSNTAPVSHFSYFKSRGWKALVQKFLAFLYCILLGGSIAGLFMSGIAFKRWGQLKQVTDAPDFLHGCPSHEHDASEAEEHSGGGIPGIGEEGGEDGGGGEISGEERGESSSVTEAEKEQSKGAEEVKKGEEEAKKGEEHEKKGEAEKGKEEVKKGEEEKKAGKEEAEKGEKKAHPNSIHTPKEEGATVASVVGRAVNAMLLLTGTGDDSLSASGRRRVRVERWAQSVGGRRLHGVDLRRPRTGPHRPLQPLGGRRLLGTPDASMLAGSGFKLRLQMLSDWTTVCKDEYYTYNKDYRGDDLGPDQVQNQNSDKSITVPSATQCCMQCYLTEQCTHFSYEKSTQRCWLKGGKGNLQPKDDYASQDMKRLFLLSMPTLAPTLAPTSVPTLVPTKVEEYNSLQPSTIPTLVPSRAPSGMPTKDTAEADRIHAINCACPKKCWTMLKTWWNVISYATMFVAILVSLVLSHDYTIMYICGDDDVDDIDDELWVMAYFIHIPKSIRGKKAKRNLIPTIVLLVIMLANFFGLWLSYILSEYGCRKGCFNNHWFTDRRTFILAYLSVNFVCGMIISLIGQKLAHNVERRALRLHHDMLSSEDQEQLEQLESELESSEVWRPAGGTGGANGNAATRQDTAAIPPAYGAASHDDQYLKAGPRTSFAASAGLGYSAHGGLVPPAAGSPNDRSARPNEPAGFRDATAAQARDWRERFSKADATGKAQLRQQILAETVDTAAKGEVRVPGAEGPMLLPTGRAVAGVASTRMLSKAWGFVLSSLKKFKTTAVEVRHVDCIDAALELRRQGLSPVLLNFANPERPGVDASRGTAGLEADLFRRTNLSQHLAGRVRDGSLAYPLAELDCVFSPDVLVLRGPERSGYPFLAEPVFLTVFSAAPYERSATATKSSTLTAAAICEAWCTKIEALFVHIAAQRHGENRHDALVLGCWGCGAAGNDPAHVAQAFRTVLRNPQFDGVFKSVIFAILEDETSYRAHNPQGKLLAFSQAFAAPAK